MTAQRSTECEIRRATVVDRVPLQRMLELYQHDLSHIWDQDLDDQGEYGYALDRYWADGDCHAFIATVAGRYAGFALVDGATKVETSGRWMDQFFVMKKYRRTGVGRSLARQVFAALPGYWEVGQMPQNDGAQAFWCAVIAQYAEGDLKEHRLRGGWWEGVVQCFRSPAGQNAP